jgi:hypothetical protein
MPFIGAFVNFRHEYFIYLFEQFGESEGGAVVEKGEPLFHNKRLIYMPAQCIFGGPKLCFIIIIVFPIKMMFQKHCAVYLLLFV